LIQKINGLGISSSFISH